MTKVWMRLLGAGLATALLAGSALAQSKPYAGQNITVLLPPWGTLPKDMTDRFTSDTGIAIDMQTLGWDDIRTKIVTSTLAGTAPADVTEVDWSWVGQFGAAGWYEPLDGVVSAALRQDAPTEKIFTFDGKLIAMPYNNDYRVLILNQAQTQKAGIDKAPTTLDDLMTDAKTVKAKAGVTYPIGLPLSATEGSATAWYLLTKAFGGDLVRSRTSSRCSPPRTRPATRRSPGRPMPSRQASSTRPRPASRTSTSRNSSRAGRSPTTSRAGPATSRSTTTRRSRRWPASAVAALMPSVDGHEPHLRLARRRRHPHRLDPQGGGRAPSSTGCCSPRTRPNATSALGNLPTRTTVLDALDEAGKLAGGKVLIEEAAASGAAVRAGHAGLVSAVLECRRHRHQPGRQGPDHGRRCREGRSPPVPRGHEAVMRRR